MTATPTSLPPAAAPTPPPVAAQSTRIVALDGLRGVAAFVVLVHHTLLASPVLARPYFSDHSPSTVFDPLIYSPLHLLWAGTEAVYIFFILSGIVLTLPVLKNARFSWRAYYPSRLVRLYIPCLAALALAVALALVVPRTVAGAHGAWSALHVMAITPVRIAHAAILVDGTNALNTAFWSLQFEVLFSLLLPVYVLIASLTKRRWWLTAIASIVIVLIGTISGNTWLTFLPMFMIGCAFAVRLDDLRRMAARVPSIGWWSLLGFAVLGITSAWWLGRTGDRAEVHLVTMVPVMLAAALFVLMAIGWPAAQRVLASRIGRWLATISFSLYLVHEPIVVSFAFLLPASLTWLVPIVAIPVCLVVAVLFQRVIEGPSHRLAQAVAARMRSRARTVGIAT